MTVLASSLSTDQPLEDYLSAEAYQMDAAAHKTKKWVTPVFCLLLVFIAAATLNPMRFTVNPYFSYKVLLAFPIAMLAGAFATIFIGVQMVQRSRKLGQVADEMRDQLTVAISLKLHGYEQTKNDYREWLNKLEKKQIKQIIQVRIVSYEHAEGVHAQENIALLIKDQIFARGEQITLKNGVSFMFMERDSISSAV